jgi:5-methylcytosine-specific restriction endonuclease McrA
MKTNRKKLSDKLDKLVAEIIRRKGKCERCGKNQNLQCAHIYSRKNKWLRWDLENLMCLCGGCHLFWWHLEPAVAIRWAMAKRDFNYLDELKRINKSMKVFDMENIYIKLKSLYY